MDFVLVVLGAEIEGRAGFRQRAEPILAGDVGDVFHQLDDALAGAALAGEQAGLIERHAIADGPFAFRDRLLVPVGHVEPWERPRCFLLPVLLLFPLRRSGHNSRDIIEALLPSIVVWSCALFH